MLHADTEHPRVFLFIIGGGQLMNTVRLPWCSAVKDMPANVGDIRDVGLISASGRSPEKEMAATPVLLPGKSYGRGA